MIAELKLIDLLIKLPSLIKGYILPSSPYSSSVFPARVAKLESGLESGTWWVNIL